MLFILSRWWYHSLKERAVPKAHKLNYNNQHIIYTHVEMYPQNTYIMPISSWDSILTTDKSMYINPHTHTHTYTHTSARVNRHIIHLFLVMRANIGAYPFLAAKARKRSLIYHNIAYVRSYHFREQNIRLSFTVNLCLPANRIFWIMLRYCIIRQDSHASPPPIQKSSCASHQISYM